MKLRHLALPCMAVLLAAAPALRADSVSGSVWIVSPILTGGTLPTPGSSFYTTPVTSTFTLSNATGTVFNMNSNGATDYTIMSFLTSGGDTVTGLSGGSTLLNSPAGCHQAPATPVCTTNAVFEFTGSLNLLNPLTVNITHDDGFVLTVDGSILSGANFPNETDQEMNTFVVPAGNHTASLFYAEVAGNPAVLTANLPLGAPPVPEPSSIALFGTGLLAAAGAVRRRLVS